MVHVTRRTLAIGFTAAAALVLVTALPAFADHTAGAELSGGENADDSCYVGGIVSGIPATLNTDNYVIKDYGGSRHIACYFETAPSYTGDESESDSYDWPWTAPAKPTKWTGYSDTCIEPGGDEFGYTEAAQSVPRFAQYRTHLVMYCSWPLDELAYP